MSGRKLYVVLLAIFLPAFSGITHAFVPLVLLQNDRLTLEVKEQPLTTLLNALADQGVRIRIDPSINPKITASFHDRPIDQAISSMLRTVDYALIWRKDRASGDDEPRLWEIRIFYKGQEERIRPLRNRINLAVTHKGDGAFHVQDILLIRVGPAMSQKKLATLLDRLGASVIDRYEPLGILRLRLPHGSDVPAIAESIGDIPGIQRAEPDYAYPLEGDRPTHRPGESPPPPSSLLPSTGGTVIAVMDSGLRPDYATNPLVQNTYDAIALDADVGDESGHGTQMALIASGAVNPLGTENEPSTGSPVVAIRTFDDNGFTSTHTLIRSIDHAMENGARVLSLSWGTENPSPLLESAIDYAVKKGLVIVAAAGNTPSGNPVYPAAYDSVIGVGALDQKGEKWEQSNFGDFVAVSAPGLAELPVGYKGDPGTYAGTSIATAYTARQVANLLNQHPDADRSTILRLLKEARSGGE